MALPQTCNDSLQQQLLSLLSLLSLLVLLPSSAIVTT